MRVRAQALLITLVALTSAACGPSTSVSPPSSSVTYATSGQSLPGVVTSPAAPMVTAKFAYLGPISAQGKTGALRGVPIEFGCSSSPTKVCAQALDEFESFESGDIVEAAGEIETNGSSYRGNLVITSVPAIVGPVDAVDEAHSRVTVLGQVVYVTFETVNGGLSGIRPGDVLRVSGFVAPSGVVIATRLSSATGASFFVRGVLQQRPQGAFAVGGLELGQQSLFYAFPGGTPLPGDMAVVTRIPSAEQPAAVVLYGGSKLLGDGITDQGRYDIRGFVTELRSTDDFNVAGVAVRPPYCECVGSESSPPIGTAVSVVRDKSGVTTVQPLHTAFYRTVVTGPIEDLDVPNGAMTVLGFRAQVTPATRIGNAVEVPLGSPRLELSALKVGDTVSVAADAVGELLIAGWIAPVDSGPSVRAFGAKLEDPYIRIAGKTIVTDSSTRVIRCNGCGDVGVATLFANKDPYKVVQIVPDTTVTPPRAIEVLLIADDDWN